MAQGNPWGQQHGFGAAPVGHGYANLPGSNPAALTAQRGFLIAMIPLHLLMFVTQSLTFALQLVTEGWVQFFPAEPFQRGEAVGRLLATSCFLLWGSLGCIWAIVNLVKLKNPTPGVHRSLTAYWWFSALSCLCFPIGIFALVNLARRDVKAALGVGPFQPPRY